MEPAIRAEKAGWKGKMKEAARFLKKV